VVAVCRDVAIASLDTTKLSSALFGSRSPRLISRRFDHAGRSRGSRMLVAAELHLSPDWIRLWSFQVNSSFLTPSWKHHFAIPRIDSIVDFGSRSVNVDARDNRARVPSRQSRARSAQERSGAEQARTHGRKIARDALRIDNTLRLTRRRSILKSVLKTYSRDTPYPRAMPNGGCVPPLLAQRKKGAAILWPWQLHDSFSALTHGVDARAKRSNH